MEIKNTTGKSLQIDDTLLNDYYTVAIQNETESYYDLVDVDNLIAKMHKSIIKDNNMPIPKHQIQLTASLYNHYFLPLRKQREKESADKLKDNFGLIMDNQERILNYGPYFIIKSDFLTSGASFAGSVNYSLGSLVESWNQSNDLILETDSSRIYIIAVRGSILSGLFYITGWSTEEGFVEFVNQRQVRLIDYMNYFNSLASSYRQQLRVNFPLIDQLLDDLN